MKHSTSYEGSMPAKQFLCLTTESRVNIWRQQNEFKHIPVPKAAFRSKAVVLLLLIYCLM